jgi:hypothetical protein
MALVSSIESSDKQRQTIHRPTQCLFSIVHGPTGEPYMQLDTYGSSERQHPEKISQSIQFDKQAAAQLLRLIQETFPELANT